MISTALTTPDGQETLVSRRFVACADGKTVRALRICCAVSDRLQPDENRCSWYLGDERVIEPVRADAAQGVNAEIGHQLRRNLFSFQHARFIPLFERDHL